MASSLFVSYSHLDREWMQVFRKHLRGTLMARCRVWTDEDIPAGATWEDVLLGELKQAGAALVLASPDYLVSPWCRRELKVLCEALKTRRLASVLWVQLRPCGWRWTELGELQALLEPATASLEDLLPGPEREVRVLQACGRVTEEMLRLAQEEDRELAMVRELIGRHPEGVNYRPLATLERGDFSVVCRGLDENSDDVVIKVLTNTPLHRMRELFLQVSQARQTVTDPSVVDVEKVFEVGMGYEARIVIISELAPKTTLADLIEADAGLAPQDRVLTPERIGIILRRLAGALAALHQLPVIHSEALGQEGYAHVMGPLVPGNVFYDERSERPQISLVGVTNFLWHFFDTETFRRIVNPDSGTYIAPEKLAQKEAGQAADQYFLGMLGLELLEGARVFLPEPEPAPVSGAAALAPLAPLAPLAALAPLAPLAALAPIPPRALLARVLGSTAPWSRHEQFRQLLCRLLQPEAADRFESMDEVVAQFHALEEPQRVLAKYAFRRWIEPEGMAFSGQFYLRFFAADPSAKAVFDRAWAQHQRDTDGAPLALSPEHHRKLVDSLKAVLNHRPGNPPSSIDSLIPVHHGRQITRAHFEAFEASFLLTLQDTLQRSNVESSVDAASILAAWQALLKPVIDEMAQRLVAPSEGG